jgi:hypothetical protein
MSKNFNVYKWRRDHLVENESTPYTKKIKDLTWDDVAGLALPTGESGGVLNQMDDRDIFTQERKDRMLQSWKERIENNLKDRPEIGLKGIGLNPGESVLDLDITIDKNNPTWFKKATITDPRFIEYMDQKEASFKAMYDRDRGPGRYQGD